MDKRKEILYLIIFFTLFLFLSSLGYMVFEKYSFIDALYMVFISITTVGYGEIEPLDKFGRIYTIFVILIGFTGFGYTIKIVTESFVESVLTLKFRRNKMLKLISEISDHYIVCGYGRIGKIITQELNKANKEVVVVDNDRELLNELIKLKIPFLLGDATDDEVLIEAGIERAKVLVASLPKDTDNLFLVLTAKQLNKNLHIIARASVESSERKLLRAGANKVFSPYKIGAMRMAKAILKPSVTDFLDFTYHDTLINEIEMDEVTISSGSPLVGKNLAESQIRKKYNAIVVAIKKEDGTMVFNPNFDYVLQEGDTLIFISEQENIDRLKKDVGESK